MAALTLREKIAEAEHAYHALQTGTMPRVVIDQNGERVEFAVANASKLYNYIQDLKGQLPSSSSPCGGRPATFTF